MIELCLAKALDTARQQGTRAYATKGRGRTGPAREWLNKKYCITSIDRGVAPCHPALADRPPSGPGWLHEIKFDGCRVIARKDGEQVRLWARTTSDYSKAFTRIRDAVAALPVDSAVIDGEAVILRPDHSFDFEALRSRQGQAEAILVAYDVMEVDGQDVRAQSHWKSAGNG